MKKIIIGLIFIMIIVYSIIGSTTDKALVKNELLGILKPEQRIEIEKLDTKFLQESYKVKFMQGGTVLKEITFEKDFIEFRVDTEIIDNGRLTYIYNDSVFNIYELYRSPGKQKLFVIKKEMVKRKILLYKKRLMKQYPDTYKPTENERIYLSKKSLIMYDVRGDKRYEVLASDIGWEKKGQFPEGKIEELPYYFDILLISDEGEIMISRTRGIGIGTSEYRFINRRGEIILDIYSEAFHQEKATLFMKDTIYFLSEQEGILNLNKLSYNGIIKRTEIPKEGEYEYEGYRLIDMGEYIGVLTIWYESKYYSKTINNKIYVNTMNKIIKYDRDLNKIEQLSYKENKIYGGPQDIYPIGYKNGILIFIDRDRGIMEVKYRKFNGESYTIDTIKGYNKYQIRKKRDAKGNKLIFFNKDKDLKIYRFNENKRELEYLLDLNMDNKEYRYEKSDFGLYY